MAKRITLLAAMALCGPWALAGDAEPTLTPHTAKYKIKISIASGTLESTVRQTPDGFDVVSRIRPTGLASVFMRGRIEERAEFQLSPDGVLPQTYSSVDELSKGKPHMDFAYDWDAGMVAGTVNEETYEYELDPSMRDRVTIQYQLMHNLVSGIDVDDYRMLDGDEVKDLRITSLGTREIKVPFGTFTALGIQHQAANSKRVSTLWCAEELGYLPVMIEQHRKGKRNVRAVLTAYEPLENPPLVAADE